MRILWRAALLGALATSAGCGGQETSDWPSAVAGCTLLETEVIDGKAAPFGFSAKEAVAEPRVRERHPLRHRDDATTTVSVGIESADLDEVLWVKRSTGGAERTFPCPEALVFRGVVRFRSEDGVYDERLATLLLAPAPDAFHFEAKVPVEQIAGTLDTSRLESVVETVTIGGYVLGDEASGRVSTVGSARGSLVISNIAWWGTAAEF